MNNYSYVTLLTSDNYLNGIILLKAGLHTVDSKFQLLCLVTEDLKQETLDELEKYDIKYQKVDCIEMPEKILEHNKKIDTRMANIWKNTFTKFNIWKLVDFDKLIFLDADLLILKNLDHCFEFDELTAAVDGEYFNLWPKDFHFNSGFMVIKPNIETYNNLIKYIDTLEPEKIFDFAGRPYVIADQDILNMYFSDWKNKPNCHLNKYYNIFAPYIRPHMESDLVKNCYFIHFIGLKPWDSENLTALRLTKEFRSNYFYSIAATHLATIKKYGLVEITDDYIYCLQMNARSFAADTLFDYDCAARLSLSKQDKEANAVRSFVSGILKNIYDKKLISNVMLFEDLAAVENGDNKVTLKYYRLFEQLVEKLFENF